MGKTDRPKGPYRVLYLPHALSSTTKELGKFKDTRSVGEAITKHAAQRLGISEEAVKAMPDFAQDYLIYSKFNYRPKEPIEWSRMP